MDGLSRRNVLRSLGWTATASLLTGGVESVRGATSQEPANPAPPPSPASSQSVGDKAALWPYFPLDPVSVAAEAYRGYPNGGCMYGVFSGMMISLAKLRPEPFQSFPCHMMKFGAGGVGHWGSLCGALNGAAAVIGLFESDKPKRESLIADLFSWYEATELPNYEPSEDKSATPLVKSMASSVLCHVSQGKWCKAAGEEVGSPEVKERCRRLTAEVAAKTVALLNAHLLEPSQFTNLNAEVKSCLKCHEKDLHDTLSKMNCNSCHQQLSKKHPVVP
jgi:hypothetical protein